MSTETQTLTTAQVAARLVELCRQGKVLEAQEELFADDVVSVEPAHSHTPGVTGKAANIEKSKEFESKMEQVHQSQISDPIVQGNWFSVAWLLDATLTGPGRIKFEEICVYHVKDGKIVFEQYFY